MEQKTKFEFGKNWKNFLKYLNEERIKEAEMSLKILLSNEILGGKRFLDIGSGSGLFSLAAKKLGAYVHSFDSDIEAIQCAELLKQQYFPDDMKWKIEKGDILNKNYILSLGKFDIVYAWGVLHHTGKMWEAMENVISLVDNNGYLILSIYNDQGVGSKLWYKIKKTYNFSPFIVKKVILFFSILRLWGPTMIKDFLKLKPFSTWKSYYKNRGMSPLIDIVDWVGGYPFEVSKPKKVIKFFTQRGFEVKKIKICGKGHGCNEFVFLKK